MNSILNNAFSIIKAIENIVPDIQNVIKTVQAAEADGKINADEVKEIMEAVLKVFSDIAISAFDIKDAVTK